MNSTGDAPDAGKNGQCRTATNVCTLRAALMEANWTSQPTRITFNIPGGGVKTIQVSTRLPTIGNPGGVTLDGYTQPGAAANTSSVVSNARIMVEVRGQGRNSFDGLVFNNTPNNVVRGLSVYKFINQIIFTGLNADNNLIAGNIVCTNAAATVQSAVSPKQIGIILQRGPAATASEPRLPPTRMSSRAAETVGLPCLSRRRPATRCKTTSSA
ncbi:MAG: hypothetical protein IPH03_08665 [Tetrasphaera sp.]|nr:hypothetical protein [Tetrasphaera sp.]